MDGESVNVEKLKRQTVLEYLQERKQMVTDRKGNQYHYDMQGKELSQLEEELMFRLDELRVDYERKIGVNDYLLDKYKDAYEKARKRKLVSNVLITMSVVLQAVILSMLALMLMS